VRSVPRLSDDAASPAELATRHILGAPSIAERTRPHLAEGEPDWAALLGEARSMSGGEELLVRIAHDLWHAEGTVGIWELPSRLGRPGFDRVLEALELLRGERGLDRARVLDEAA
jgi:hypothetical protein